jgi:drug/metabolite transporter (DMT)-like permease
MVYGNYTERKVKIKKMDLIEKGLWKTEYEPKAKPEGALLVGLILAGIGMAILACSFWVILEVGQWLRLGGLIFFLIGIALIIYYAIIKRTTVQH